jgi:cellobiose phosphorylase
MQTRILEMNDKTSLYQYLGDGISFRSDKASSFRTTYFPLCGVDAQSVKSSISPFLSGDIKIDKYQYITKPVSTEDLRQPLRNFFVRIDGGDVISLAERTSKEAYVEIGPMWHKLVVRYAEQGIQMEALNFVPVSGENVELMRVKIMNISDTSIKFTPTAAIPIFGRALANKHDHEHVTSLLHRIQQISQGVVVRPSMSFNEEGHKPNNAVYFVLGTSSEGESPIGSFPTMDTFYGDGGTAQQPEAVMVNATPRLLSGEECHGKEAVGALRFKDEALDPKESKEYFMLIGAGDVKEQKVENVISSVVAKFHTAEQYDDALENVKAFWREKSSSVTVKTKDADFDSWMHWVTIQPVLRRIYGCSFLPDHDYGKGGKGWRDIWQDLLSLILIEPDEVRETLINNFAGVRIDGSNATIIGSKPGEFLADRNAITRVWMDHGVWPLMTLALYIHQAGDVDILLEENTYFKDQHISRTFGKDNDWTLEYGNNLKTQKGQVYRGSIIEHVLVQNLVQFFNVGEHNIIRLESADWNDGLDMAFDRGESVAFMSCYAGNLHTCADLLESLLQTKNIQTIELAEELTLLLDRIHDKGRIDYDNIEQKKEVLFHRYFKVVEPELSGVKKKVAVSEIIKDLREKAAWIFEFIRKTQKIEVDEKGEKYTWFNGYYDNCGERVEGQKQGRVWMTLTGQVFPIMSGVATQEDIQGVVKSVRAFLKDKVLGGFRLNTDFGLDHYLDLGRAFGFAFGTKENGAFFSHMTVMYAYALYKQGFAHAGHEVLSSIYQMSNDTERSHIYPGVPEYFDGKGKGMYHYLTGSASWYVLTELTQVFGVRGEQGDLLLAPKIVREQFSEDGIAQVECKFAGKRLSVTYVNKEQLDYGAYQMKSIVMDGKTIEAQVSFDTACAQIARGLFEQGNDEIHLEVILGAL